jgi:hypothetical protein
MKGALKPLFIGTPRGTHPLSSSLTTLPARDIFMLKRAAGFLCRLFKLKAADFLFCGFGEKLTPVTFANQRVNGFY